MRSKKKLLLSIVIIMMVIVFAVGTTEVFLHGSINISDSEDLDVYFSKAILDEVEKNELIIDKKHIVYETGYLKDPSEESELVYEVANNSKQYDANINITCRTDKEDLVNIVIEPNEIEIKSGERKEGSIKVNTKKYVVDETTANISCELNVEAVERTEIGEGISNCELNPGKTWEFETVGEDEFKVPCDGEYKLEVWGAQGGSASLSVDGGYGAFAVGEVNLNHNETLHINVGGEGLCTDGHSGSAIEGGYNGGGGATRCTGDSRAGQLSCAGGGATHIATESGELQYLEENIGQKKNNVYDSDVILIVAAGGGGAIYLWDGNLSSSGGHAGGIEGSLYRVTSFDITYNSMSTTSRVPSQFLNSFIDRQSLLVESSFGNGSVECSGGGGGWYGGSSWEYTIGGSSYIGSSKLTNKAMYCYDCETSEDEDTKTITEGVTAEETAISKKAKKGSGYARITYLGNKKYSECNIQKNTTWKFDNVGEEEFEIPCDGNYKLEVWGAQGGNSSDTYIGGYGGYSVGNINLKKNIDHTLFVNVGGQGQPACNLKKDGGYNGGGTAQTLSYDDTAASGGGATHIALQSGELKDLKGEGDIPLLDKILIVAGGGGGGYSYYNFNSEGGHAGGYKGGITPNGTCSGRTLLLGNSAQQNIGGTGNGCGKDYTSTYTSFGKGADGVDWESGGGGGLYGGGQGYAHGGNGGSSFIGHSRLVDKAMYCYNCETSNDEDTKTITEGVTAEETAISKKAKKGNGYAKITYLG